MAKIPLNTPASVRQPKAVPAQVKTLKPIPPQPQARKLKLAQKDPRRRRCR